MKAIVLAGGKGTRLQSVVKDTPKPLAQVQNQPFLFILIRFLAAHGISEIFISTGYLSEKFKQIEEELRRLFPHLKLVEETSPLGTGGAVRNVCSHFNENETVLVLNGDTFFNFDLINFIKNFIGQNAIALTEVFDASRYGTVELNDGRVERFTEKENINKSGTIFAGYCLLNTFEVLKILPQGASSLEKDFLSTLAQRGELKGEKYEGQFIDIGVPSDYKYANQDFDFSQYLGGKE